MTAGPTAASRAFPPITPTTPPSASAGWSRRNSTCTSMPTATKNREIKTSRNGSSSAIAWWPLVGLRDHESRQEGAQGERCPRRRRSQGGERPDQDDRDQEQLPTPGLEDLREGARDHGPGEHQHPDDDEHRLAEREEQRPGTAAGPSGEKREDQHHRHDAQVLEDQHAGREASPWGASISPLSVSPLRTMAVLESATRQPRSSDTRQLTCRATASPAPSATVRPTWAPPPRDDLPP